ncbi:MAG: tetratricopeptide repeat protein [Candidatus Obscuribacterales bacterium]|nr:tetratricopeptide repeat protein [Candidatus Obscuribacterales bacterium]
MSKVSLNSTLSIALALTLGIFAAYNADARSDQQVKYKRTGKSFDSAQETVLDPSLFKRRPGYREIEAQKKEEEEKATQKAIDDAKKAQLDKANAEKARKQGALAANNQGVQLGKSGRWAEAIAAHEKAVQLEPENKQLRINLSAACVVYGQTKMAAGDNMAASAAFRKALLAAPDNGLAGKLLADATRKLGRDPESAEARMEIGDQLLAAGDVQSAVLEYQAAMQLEDSGRTYAKMGDLALRVGQTPTALNWYQQAIVKDPDCAQAHRQLGLLLLNQKDLTGAVTSLRKALILNPNDTAAGQALVELWQRQMAANPLQPENHLGLAGAYQLTGNFAGAAQEYGKLEAIDPQNTSLAAGRASLERAMAHARSEKHRLAAETLLSQGLSREALIEIKQAAGAEPKNARYQFMLAQCLEAVSDFKGAHQAYLTCVLIDPVNNKNAAARLKRMQDNMKVMGTSSAELTDLANQLAKEMSATPAAAQAKAAAAVPAAVPAAAPQITAPAKSAATTENTVADPAMVQVAALEAQGNYKAAAQLLNQLVTNNMNNAELHHRLAVNLKAAGQLGEALSEFRIAAAFAPGNAEFAKDLSNAVAANKANLLSEGKRGQ